jgi:hypothetical protein
MTSPGDDLTRYRTELLFALRQKQIPGSRISEIIAAVEHRVTRSGEDPNTVFGSPAEYAASIATVDAASAIDWSVAWIAIATGGASGFLTAYGLLRLLPGEDAVSGSDLFGIQPFFVFLIGIVFAGLAVLHVRRYIHPSGVATHGPVEGPGTWWVALGIVALMLGIPVAVELARELV